MSKSDEVRYLIKTTQFQTKQIAALAGCDPSLVRSVRRRSNKPLRARNLDQRLESIRQDIAEIFRRIEVLERGSRAV
jgi:hypothetical protein